MRLSALADMIGVPLIGTDVFFNTVCTDTRSLTPDSLFFALGGDNHDAHDFVLAVDGQLTAAVVSQPGLVTCPHLVVPDTRLALGQLAQFWRSMLNADVIGITGSCGKTTTRAILAAILQQAGSVLGSEKSYNNDVGVPKTLLRGHAAHQYAAIEMGMSHAGEMDYLANIVKPDGMIIVNVAPVHVAQFPGGLDDIAAAKSECLPHVSPTGWAILPNNAYLTTWRQRLPAGVRVITAGLDSQHDVFATGICLRPTDSEWTVHDGEFSVSVRLPLPGEHNVLNALFAIAAARQLGLSAEMIQRGCLAVNPPPQRLARRSFQGSLILDDSYNANQLAVERAVDVLLLQPAQQRILVLGDLLELGDTVVSTHAAIGRYARAAGVNALYAVGEGAHVAARAFGDQGVCYPDQAQLVAAMRQAAKAGTVFLVKGSHGSQMHAVIEALIKKPQ